MGNCHKVYKNNPMTFLLLYYVLAGSMILIAVGATGLWNGWHSIDAALIIFGIGLMAIYHYFCS